MQPGPGSNSNRSVRGGGFQMLLMRSRPRRFILASEACTMHPRTTALETRTVGNIEIEAAVPTNAHQDSDLLGVMQLRQTGGIVATIEHE